MNLLEFLRVAGYHSRVNTMLGRERFVPPFHFAQARFMFTVAVACSVRARLDSKEGISFTEFTYQLLQAYDFQELHRSLGCTIQVGGSDQWGNILAGVDLINRIADSEQGPGARDKAYGITTPLLTNSSGLKFSKSTGTAVWLDRTLSSYQDFYQVFVSHSAPFCPPV
jgi:tyrosyl-tRNA synthetase